VAGVGCREREERNGVAAKKRREEARGRRREKRGSRFES